MKLLFAACLFTAALASFPPLPYFEEACNEETRPRQLDASTPGVFRTEGWPNGTYPENALCEWVIRQDQNLTLQLEFLNFTLESSEECKSDYVEVYQGDSIEGTLVGRFCGQEGPNPITANEDALFVRFESDSSINYQGFLARYGEIYERTACTLQRPQVITQELGTVLTENYPADYPPSATCEWRFEAEEGETWTLDILDFETENCCDCDYLEIYDGIGLGSTRLGLWYGVNTIPPRITSSTNYLYVRFRSDFSVNRKGFIGAFVKNTDDDDQ